MYQKSWWYDPQFLRYRAWGTEIGKFGSCFVLLPKILASKITIIWCRFPRYEVRQTEFFAILGHFFFCPFTPLNKPENQNFEKIKKKHLEMSSFYTCVPKITIILCFLRCEVWQSEFFVRIIFGPFFALLPP